MFCFTFLISYSFLLPSPSFQSTCFLDDTLTFVSNHRYVVERDAPHPTFAALLRLIFESPAAEHYVRFVRSVHYAPRVRDFRLTEFHKHVLHLALQQRFISVSVVVCFHAKEEEWSAAVRHTCRKRRSRSRKKTFEPHLKKIVSILYEKCVCNLRISSSTFFFPPTLSSFLLHFLIYYTGRCNACSTHWSSRVTRPSSQRSTRCERRSCSSGAGCSDAGAQTRRGGARSRIRKRGGGKKSKTKDMHKKLFHK